jgi:hypothetical protein
VRGGPGQASAEEQRARFTASLAVEAPTPLTVEIILIGGASAVRPEIADGITGAIPQVVDAPVMARVRFAHLLGLLEASAWRCRGM